MVNNFIMIYVYFIICAFIGWIVESIYWSCKIKKISNSGFLYGPFIPIYGFGALSIYFVNREIDFLILPVRFLLYTLIATILEYVSSLVLEKIFNIKLWDYSQEKFNLHGRICLKFTFYWFLLIIFNIFLLQPLLFGIIKKINISILIAFTLIFTIYLVIDLFFSAKLYFYFANMITRIQPVHLGEVIKKNLKQKINSFLIPINHFPDLTKEVIYNMSLFSNSFVNELKTNIQKVFDINTITENFTAHHEDEILFYKIYSEIVYHPQYQLLKNYNHHNNMNIYEHNIKVAWISYHIGKKFNLKLKDITKGALLHDFFHYDWRYEKPQSGKLHGFHHPKESLDNAMLYYSPLTLIEKDIIIKHMWPLTIHPPKYIESFIVCIVDKIVATYEFVFTKKEN